MKYRFLVWLVIGGLPLLVYPFVLLANVMSLAASPSSRAVPILLYLSANVFLWGSTLYPGVCIFCAARAFAISKNGNPHKAAIMALLPLLYLALVLAAMTGWMAMGAL